MNYTLIDNHTLKKTNNMKKDVNMNQKKKKEKNLLQKYKIFRDKSYNVFKTLTGLLR